MKDLHGNICGTDNTKTKENAFLETIKIMFEHLKISKNARILFKTYKVYI